MIGDEKEVYIYKEHGDFAVYNILDVGKNLWLMVFEFSRSFQVIGCDLHDFRRTFAMHYLARQDIFKLKDNMRTDVNDVLDNDWKKDNEPHHKNHRFLHIFRKKH